jgi:hypothetical protein
MLAVLNCPVCGVAFLYAKKTSLFEGSKFGRGGGHIGEAGFPHSAVMHQPVFLSDFFQEIGNADEISDHLVRL